MLVAKLIQELTRSRAKEKNHEIHESPRESTHSFAKAIVVARAYRQGTSSCSWAFTYSTYSFNAEVRSVNRKGKRRCAELFLCHDIADPSYERATLVSTARWILFIFIILDKLIVKEINKEKWQLDQENEVTAATLKIRKREKIKNPEITC